jgi:murein DD-endopeptidase MepM/ murein hydrolase activator NlpD
MATLADSRLAVPRLSRAVQGFVPPAIQDLDLAVDLGDSIGSARWWRGMALLLALVAAALALASRIPSLPAALPVPAPGAPAETTASRITSLSSGSRMGQRALPTNSVVRLSEVPERPRIELAARVGAGGSLEAALRRAGVGRDDLATVLALVRGAGAARALKPDTEIALIMGRRENRTQPRPLDSLSFRAAFDLRLDVIREGGQLVLQRIPIAVDDTPLRVQGEVGRSLHATLKSAGIPGGVIADFLRQIGHVVDIQREIRGRDRFDLIVEHRRAETGETEFGRLIYAGIEDGKQKVALMRFGPQGEFYRENGESARKGLIRTPVEGARMSSGFGMRFHPILGFSRMHQGLDFAAPSGTPVLASATGKVIKAGWGGGYGNVVQIQHGRGIVTRYAHLSRIDVRPGQTVGQGARIGAVGSTGLSTGPHLHYEVWVNGVPVNPKQARYLSGNQLTGAELSRFRAEIARIRQIAPGPRD